MQNVHRAFGPRLLQYGSECHLCYQAEQDVKQSIHNASGALTPKDMLKLVPDWVKKLMATDA
jgi:hypothetical protein